MFTCQCGSVGGDISIVLSTRVWRRARVLYAPAHTSGLCESAGIMLTTQDVCVTVFGRASVVKTARIEDHVVELRLDGWTLANGKHPALFAPEEKLARADTAGTGASARAPGAALQGRRLTQRSTAPRPRAKQRSAATSSNFSTTSTFPRFVPHWAFPPTSWQLVGSGSLKTLKRQEAKVVT